MKNRKLLHVFALGIALASPSSLHATVLFSDSFDSYANGTADGNYTAAYNGISGAPTCVVTTGTGLGGSKSLQAPGATDMTLIRKSVAIDLTVGTVTNSLFFQRVSAQIAAPQIGLMSELSGALNTVNSVGGRLNQFDQLDVRSSEGGVQSSAGSAVAVGVPLTNGNWYNLRAIITKTGTPNSLTVVLQLWNSDPNGVVGTLIASNTQTATNASVWADTTLYAAVRLNNGNSGVSNLDSLSANQASTSPTITLTGTLGTVDTTYGIASPTPTSFQISGSSLTGVPGDLTVTPPSGFEVSRTNNSGYSTSLSVPYSSGTLAGTNVYVRLAATTAVGTYSGNIIVSGGGATAQTMATAASTVFSAGGPPVVNSFTLMYPGTGGPVPGYDPITNNATIDLSLTGTILSIRANTSPSNDFGSVAFNLTGATTQSQTDNTYPWSLSGDSGGSYTGRVFNVGAHTLTGTPFPADGGGGSAGTAATISFTTVNPAVGYPPLGYQLVWADEFNGTTLDTSKWGYENPGKWRDGYNTPNAVSVTNGLLTITTYTQNGTNFTCELNTYNKFTPKYGYMEASIDFNDSPGMWSAFWLYNYSVPTVGNPKTNGVEVDIIEHLAHNTSDVDVSNLGFSTLHWDGYGASHQSVTSGNYNSGFATGFHTCALLWTPDAYKFIMDGVVVWTTTNAPAQDPVPPASPVSQIGEFLLLSSEVWSNNWAGTIPPGGYGSLATSTTKMKVDYVRFYQSFPDTNPPAVLNLTPTNGSSLFVNLPIQVSATVTDNVAVAFAQLYLDGTNMPPAVSNAPYSFTLTNVALGAHGLKVVGQDTTGNRATNSVNVTVIQPPPTIALTGTLGAVSTTYGTASATPTSFQIAGSDLTGAQGNLTVTPPSGYEVSRTNNSAYSSSLLVPYSSGTLAGTNVYVRLAATTAVGTYAGSITVAGGGDSKTLATTSSTVSKANATITVTSYNVTYDGDPKTATVSTITGANGETGATVGSITLSTTHTSVGTYASDSWNFTGTANYNNIGSSPITNIINAKAASVTAVAKSKAYGDVNPDLTAVTNGAVNGDVINVTLATDATQFSSVGVSNITLTLGSNPNYSVLTTNSTLTINPASTTMALASDTNPALPGTNVTFTATVSSGAGNPTGSVTFKDGISTLGTSSLNGAAQAALSTPALAPGNHIITAEYAGGANFSGSTNSPALTQVINLPTPPSLSFITTGGGLQLSWDAPGFTLQQAAVCTGPWTNLVPTPTSPLAITLTNPATFFRLLWNAP